MRALPGERPKILCKKQRIFGLVVRSSPAATPKTRPHELTCARLKFSLQAALRPTRLKPELRTSPPGRRGRPWERTLPVCPACLTHSTQDACAPRRTKRNPFQMAKEFGVSNTEAQWLLPPADGICAPRIHSRIVWYSWLLSLPGHRWPPLCVAR